ncbi:MAG: S8 family serine peptidase [Ignavibacteriae bacterium]|nr:S8 family serine peptidase [Ignavibacteriota bacterium]
MKRILLVAIILLCSFVLSSAQQRAPLGTLLSRHLPSIKENDEQLVLIIFKDKGAQNLSVTSPRSLLSAKAIARRAKVRSSNNIIDVQDLPLEQSYVENIKGVVVRVRHQLKWFNAVSAVATKQQIESLRALPYVQEVELVGRWKTDKSLEKENDEFILPQEQELLVDSLNYGNSFTQINQIKVNAVHNLGIYGQGIVVGVFDNGVRLLNHEAFLNMNIIAMYDFVDHKKSVVPINTSTGFGSHGVSTLSIIGGYKPGQVIGPAFGATYILARTENDSSETPIEEDNWAKAIEWADSIGVDVASTSLGYGAPGYPYDPPYVSWTWQDMNGNTTLVTRAADRAVGLGIVVLNSAGNSGSDVHNTLGAPADGDSVITVGAVTSSGGRASYSSVGPTTDIPSRIKPDIMAMGSGVWYANGSNPLGYTNIGSGTSFSCPLSAGVATLVLCANPSLTPMQVRDAMRQTASNAASPNNTMGWGILNARNAISYFGISPNVRGVVFNDLDADGTKDTNETGLAGALVSITGTKTDSTYTDADGNYLLDNLSVGNFSITITPPVGKKLLFPSNGSYGITIDSSKLVQTGKDFVIVEYGTVQGSTFDDINGNGTKQAGEPGLENWKAKLGSRSALTDADGNFIFSTVDAGSYTLSESLHTGWMKTTPAGNYSVNINWGDTKSGYSFGVFKLGSIQGQVFQDYNSDGIQDSNETGIGNWRIQLNGPVTGSVLTDSNGNFSFTNLTAGTYTLSESLMYHWVQTYPFSNGAHSIIIRSGSDTTNLDFGTYYAPNMVCSVSSGWNLLSLPQQLENYDINTIYPDAGSKAYLFKNKTYTTLDTIPDGVGFWLKFPYAANISIVGDLKTSDTIAVQKGWNIIGTISEPVAITDVVTQPDSLINSQFFYYNGTYQQSDSLFPHFGYWVKTKNAGQVILQSPTDKLLFHRRK